MLRCGASGALCAATGRDGMPRGISKAGYGNRPARGKRGGLAAGVKRRAGTPLAHDRAPWEVEGISRAWWYRKRQHALGVDRSQYS